MSKWIVPCAGNCGKRLKRGSNSRARPMCRACRARWRVWLCEYCSRPFRRPFGRMTQEYCCRSHAMLARWQKWHDEHDEESGTIPQDRELSRTSRRNR